MMRILILFLFLQGKLIAQVTYPLTPDKQYGALFTDVQLKRIFPDSKTFVDCIPLFPPDQIVKSYSFEKNKSDFDLRSFVFRNFRIPGQPKNYHSSSKNIRQHINRLWKVLKRSADSTVEGSSLLPLSNPYIVPGGRFREVYYWDSYFTMLGLKESGEYEMMENMVKNFAYLINTYGHIPNGNRSYYLSRSQPPFFSLMVELLASVKGKEVYTRYRDVLKKELSYWTNTTTENGVRNSEKAVELRDANGNNYFLSRYSDDFDIPRQESYAEDVATAEEAALEYRKRVRFADSNVLSRHIDSIKARVWHNLRSAAASGWDFSSRWFLQGEELNNTETPSIIPVDLNCLVYHLNLTYKRSSLNSDPKEMELFSQKTREKFRKLFFNEQLGWYCDTRNNGDIIANPTLAGMYPLFFKLADKKDVPRIVEFLKTHFLKNGGVVTSLNQTGQQWDAPNGWPPLQWITIIGLENYGYHSLAKEIATRWVNLNKKVFLKTGRLMEKYDVININKPSGGGEYPSQDGFGWTNGVLLALMNKYKLN
jgi:alpha,alpha-trehalase